jgi:exopolysaccharide biosynthesis protein
MTFNKYRKYFFRKALCGLFFFPVLASAQLKWELADSLFPGMPSSVHVYRSASTLHGRPNKAWYVEADLSDRNLIFDTDTSYKRRLTPARFYEKNNEPLLVVNGTFFSFTENRNLNLVMHKGRLVAYNVQSFPGRGKDTLLYHKMTRSAIGISKKRKADVAWLFTDTAKAFPLAFEDDPVSVKDSVAALNISAYTSGNTNAGKESKKSGMRKRWKMETAIGGGPVLVQNSKIRITNNEERMFAGKAENDLHPRTAMGYTANGKLLILVVEGRNPGKAEGASLPDLANIFLSLGAVEALNLDGGGSSCMLVQGKETIRPSDKEGQRAIPAVFMIKYKK